MSFDQPIYPDLDDVSSQDTNSPQKSSEADKKALIDNLRASFEAKGYRIDYDPDYDELYKLNLIITRIKDIHAHVNLGVLATLNTDDLALQDKFLEGSRRGVVHKSIYIEVNDNTASTGAIPVAIAACMSFLFDRRYSNYKCIGLRIFEDCTFHFFDIDENVRRLRRDSQDESTRLGQDMSGNIIAYFTDKGFGFIETSDDMKFFFHIANVMDDDLRVQLPAYIPGDVMPVTFKYGGNDGKKYPKAIDVLLEDGATPSYGSSEPVDDPYDDPSVY